MKVENITHTMLTVVLLLKDRTEFTWRWLDYIDYIKFPYKVIIADGGYSEDVENKFKNGNPYNSEITYIRYPYDKTLDDFYNKKLDALSKVDTPYVLLSSNDDFYIINGINDSLVFLNDNKNYIAARAEVYSISMYFKHMTNKSTVCGEIKNIRRFANPLYYRASFPEKATDRLSKIFELQIPMLWHDVFRTDFLKKQMHILKATGLNDLKLFGHLVDTLCLLSGKIKHIDGLHMLHQSNAKGSLGKEITSNSHLNWITSPGWFLEFDKFLKPIAQHIEHYDEMTYEDALLFSRNSYINHYIKVRIALENHENNTWIRPFEKLFKPITRLKYIWFIEDSFVWLKKLVKRSVHRICIHNIFSWKNNLLLSKFHIGPYHEELRYVYEFMKFYNTINKKKDTNNPT